MLPQSGRLIPCIFLAFVINSHGLHFSMDTTPNSFFCGHLYCWTVPGVTDSDVFSVVGLSIYDVTQTSLPAKLASLSVFDSELYIENNTIFELSATGNISKYHAELTVDLQDNNYCLNTSFLCELKFVNASGDPGLVREMVWSGNSRTCLEIEEENAEFERENDELRQENMALKTDVTRLQQIVNSFRDVIQETCFKGMPHSSPRETFLLWGSMAALCDTETDGGGWIVIQRRTAGDMDFYRGWTDYKNGFGTPATDFWIGNEIIHNLTSHGYTELRIDMTSYRQNTYFAQYSHVYVGSETSNYRLSVSEFDGNTKDSLFDHDGMQFSTYDRDNDAWGGNCAFINHGAWWYNACYQSNLNGLWGSNNYTGLSWDGIVTEGSVASSEIKLRYA